MSRRIPLYELVSELQKLPNKFTVNEAVEYSKLFENRGIGMALRIYSEAGYNRKGIELKKHGVRRVSYQVNDTVQSRYVTEWQWQKV